jgi:hypothetical protein
MDKAQFDDDIHDMAQGKSSRRDAVSALARAPLGLLGGQRIADAAAREPPGTCKKFKNKKQRKKCNKRARRRYSNQGPSNPQDSNLRFPVRGAFYYPWFPHAWTQADVFPYTNYQPSLGYYDGGTESTIKQHIAAMQYGGITLGITSWWGIGHRTDARIPALLAGAAGTGFRWAIYHEQEGEADLSVAQIEADLTHIRDQYADDPSYARVDGKFVVFVYNADDRDCAVSTRWQQANTVGAYVVLKTLPGYLTCDTQPQSWHQYTPAIAADHQPGYSYSISPGFWQKGKSVRLARDLNRWQQNVRDMVASDAPWQLVTTFNEWGEGTAVESAAEWETASGYGSYLDALHRNGIPPR